MRDVAIIGAGMTAFGELWGQSFRQLFVEAALAAVQDAGVDQLDSMYVGTMSGGLFVGQEHVGSLMADYLGVAPIPATRVESACASSGVAFRLGFMEVASGLSDVVLVGGVEKMNDGADVTYALSTAADQEYEVFHGITFPGLYAMIARAHMHRYGTTREQLAAVAVKNHANGLKNPKAQFRMKVTAEQVMNSSKVADPLRLLDCSPVTDGAAAVILCPMEMAEKLTDKLVQVIGSGQATDTIGLHDRSDLTTLNAVKRSAEMAYKMAGVGPGDLDVVEVHDCFTIAEICNIEALGLVEPGTGGSRTMEGFTALDGQCPVNTSGGLKSKGHPVGATGVAQIIEIYHQLTGACGDRQVNGARIGLAQNMGGSGGSSSVHILKALS